MNQNFENSSDEEEGASRLKHEVALVERDAEPRGITLVNAMRVSKKSHSELQQLEEGLRESNAFNNANIRNKLDVIGKQMKHLQGFIREVISETKLNTELNHVACNFVKKPGHIYHLYQRPSGQKYFSMLSPQEWINAPHNFLGSFHLEMDMSWTAVGQEDTRYEGLAFLKDIFTKSEMKALLHLEH